MKENGSNGFLVGEKLTLADLGLLECVLYIEEIIGVDSLKPYPEIEKFSKSMKSIEQISAYINGPQRPKRTDETLVEVIKKVLPNFMK